MSGIMRGDAASTATDKLTVALRAYGVPEGREEPPILSGTSRRGPSRWNLIFDTETTADPVLRLRFGAYQLRYGDELRDTGLFYDPAALSEADVGVLKNYTDAKHLKLLTNAEFVEKIFLRAAYHWQATTIGFNLPFDLSRIAYLHSDARGKMRGGFSFHMAPEGMKAPRIRIKHLSRKASLIDMYGSDQKLSRGMRKRKIYGPRRRPAFVDVHTLAHAVLGRSSTLGALANTLETPHRKLGTDEHGKPLTPEYLDYALQDVQVTWECFTELRRRFELHGLERLPIHHVYSEASIGKGYLRQMGIRPWREVQRDFPDELVGIVMGTYFGGRAEVHLRRVIRQVAYCDFTSMYPTVCSLMGLWRLVIADGVDWHDATDATQRLLDSVTLADLQHPAFWEQLHVLVEVDADADILPVRARYGREPQYTIGLNYLTSADTLWFTLADCIASKLLTGKATKIARAIAFTSRKVQRNLNSARIASTDYTIDPTKDDFYRRIVERRQHVKALAKKATDEEAERLKAEEAALKTIANSIAYGVYVQLNVDEEEKPVAVRCHPAKGRPFLVDMNQVEEPGEFFHPLLGTLITGGARLMLAIAERLILDQGLDWAFCDTDSMAIAKPEGMIDKEFFARVESIRNWFAPLNPYDMPLDMFKLEDANYRIGGGGKNMQPLFCFAVSSKRYVLFNVDDQGRPIIRKASAHGLGHLLPPYGDAVPLEEIGVARWQHDVWYRIVLAALAGRSQQVQLRDLANVDQPAVGRYAATTPPLLAWFEKMNEGRPYAEQIRPFNFMLMFQADRIAAIEELHGPAGDALRDKTRGKVEPYLPRAVAGYRTDPAEAASQCFDRETGRPVPRQLLKTYAQALAQFHLRPEAKFLDADFLDSGPTRRRHVEVHAIVYIGKEANRWEEQSYIGLDEEAEIEYGIIPEQRKSIINQAREAGNIHGQRALAKAAELSLQQVSAILRGQAAPTNETLAKLIKGMAELDRKARVEQQETDTAERRLREMVAELGFQVAAVQLEIDAGNFSRMMSGKRRLTPAIVRKLRDQAFLRNRKRRNFAR